MKSISALLQLVAEFIATDPTTQRIQNLSTVMTLYIVGETDELTEFIKTKYIGKFIDNGVTATPALSEAKNMQMLLDETETFLKENEITLYSYDNGKFYHPDTLDWFPNAEMHQTAPEFLIPGLPKGGMTEGDMIKENSTLEMECNHHLDEYIRSIKVLFENGTLKKGDKNKYFIGMLTDQYGDNACKVSFGFGVDGEFYFDVRKVSSGLRWSGFNSFFLSNKRLKA